MHLKMGVTVADLHPLSQPSCAKRLQRTPSLQSPSKQGDGQTTLCTKSKGEEKTEGERVLSKWLRDRRPVGHSQGQW